MATLLPNMPEYPILFMAAAESGLLVTPLNPLYTPGEIKGQLVNSEAKLVLTLPHLVEKVREATVETEIKIVVIGESRNSLQQLVGDGGGDLLSG